MNEALRYKSVGSGFDSQRCNWNFSWHYGPGVDSTCNRNEYQEYFLWGKCGRCVGMTTLPTLCVNCLEILDAHPSGTLSAFPGLYRDCFNFPLYSSGNSLRPIFCSL